MTRAASSKGGGKDKERTGRSASWYEQAAESASGDEVSESEQSHRKAPPHGPTSINTYNVVPPKQLKIGFHPPVLAVRNDPPFCPVGRDRWRGGQARHRPCLPKPMQLTNEAQVRFHRRNGVVAAKMEDETRSDHRTIILLQIQEPPAVAGCLRIYRMSARGAIFGREPAKAAIYPLFNL